MGAVQTKKGQASSSTVLPGGLVEAVTNRRVVLFMGAGASMEARGDKGERPLSARDLRDRLASDFLGRSFDDADLMSVADMAIESSGQSVVFERIRSLLSPLRPTRGHLLLPTFRWRALLTTNYDDLVEQAYRARVRNQLQGIVPIVKNTEPVEELLQSTENPVLLLKLTFERSNFSRYTKRGSSVDMPVASMRRVTMWLWPKGRRLRTAVRRVDGGCFASLARRPQAKSVVASPDGRALLPNEDGSTVGDYNVSVSLDRKRRIRDLDVAVTPWSAGPERSLGVPLDEVGGG